MGRIWPFKKSSSAELMDPADEVPLVETLLAEKSNSNEQVEEVGETSGWEDSPKSLLLQLLMAVESMKCIGLAGAL